MQVRSAITIRRPVDEVYAFWRSFENLPRFMYHLESVDVTGTTTSHWKAKAPAGTTVEWDATITVESPGSFIAWESVEGADVRNSGTVRFSEAPGDQGTEVFVELDYDPPGGALGAVVAKLFGEEPLQQVRDDLRRFKQIMECGEVTLSDGSPDGTRTAPLAERDAQPQGEEVRA